MAKARQGLSVVLQRAGNTVFVLLCYQSESVHRDCLSQSVVGLLKDVGHWGPPFHLHDMLINVQPMALVTKNSDRKIMRLLPSPPNPSLSLTSDVSAPDIAPAPFECPFRYFVLRPHGQWLRFPAAPSP